VPTTDTKPEQRSRATSSVLTAKLLAAAYPL
jgi:hypothetical protein